MIFSAQKQNKLKTLIVFRLMEWFFLWNFWSWTNYDMAINLAEIVIIFFLNIVTTLVQKNETFSDLFFLTNGMILFKADTWQVCYCCHMHNGKSFCCYIVETISKKLLHQNIIYLAYKLLKNFFSTLRLMIDLYG